MLLEWFEKNGESTIAKIPKRNSGSARRYVKLGRLIRRKVTLKQESSRVVWAYRLPFQSETLFSYEPIERDPISKRKKLPIKESPKVEGEPDFSYYLRNLGRGRR
jgi:hypothetical protein